MVGEGDLLVLGDGVVSGLHIYGLLRGKRIWGFIVVRVVRAQNIF